MAAIYLRLDWEEEKCKISGDSTGHYRGGEQLDIKNRTFIFQEGILVVVFSYTNDVAGRNKEMPRDDIW